MKIWQLIWREILFRKFHFSVCLISNLLAVGFCFYVMAFLKHHDKKTEQHLLSIQKDTEAQVKELNDQIRKATLKGGFHLHIFPPNESIERIKERGFAMTTMREDLVFKLANTKILTINHLRPVLMRHVLWPEKNRKVFLMGVREEVPLSHKSRKKPVEQHVETGEVILGHELKRSLGFRKGDSLVVMGKSFRVKGHLAERGLGSKDDLTLFVNLKDAQELLKLPGQISAIHALECNCASYDRLAEVRSEVSRILDGVQVIETGGVATVRAETRTRVKEAGIARLKKARSDLEAQTQSRQRYAFIILAATVLICALWIGLSMSSNTRERQSEIGILRALGVGTLKIKVLFLGKSVIVSVIGAILGLLLSNVALYLTIFENNAYLDSLHGLQMEDLAYALVGAVVFSLLSSWYPVQSAIGKSPATVLMEE